MANQVPVYDSTHLGRAPTLSAFVESLAKTGSAALTGAVTLTGGTNVTLTQAGNDISIAASGGGGGAAKLYDYTVTGSDKASIDTNVDGTTVANFAGYDILTVYVVARTDEAGAVSQYELTLNNDTGANYDEGYLSNNNTTVIGSTIVADTKILVGVHGSGGGGSYAAPARLVIPGYAGTTFFKGYELVGGNPDSTAANNYVLFRMGAYKSTSAVTRVKIAAAGAAKFKVGTRMMVYGQ